MRNNILTLIPFLFISIPNSYAQETKKEKIKQEIETIERNLIKSLPVGVRYLRTYRHLYFGSAKTLAERTLILFKGITYYFTGSYEEDCDTEESIYVLYNQDRKEIFSHQMKNKVATKGIFFQCSATGIYYLTLKRYYCDTSVVIGIIK